MNVSIIPLWDGSIHQGFFKADLGVNFALRFFGVTPRFCSAAATAVLSYTKAALSYTKVSTLKKTLLYIIGLH